VSRSGRKSKPGKRYPNGKRKIPTVTYDRGSEWVQGQRKRYGEHYGSALGRAFAAGLLGEDAQRLFDAGKHFVRTYNRILGGPGYRCALDDTPRGGNLALVEDHDPDRQEWEVKQQRWLYAIMDSLDVDGSRPWLDQLIHTNYIDHGPLWLDRLLAGGKDPADLMFLKAAMRALDVIAPEKQKSRILAA
jgi:hypothetical protein